MTDTLFQALSVTPVDPESPWGKKLQSTLNSKQEKTVAYGMQIDDLKGLRDGDRLWLMDFIGQCAWGTGTGESKLMVSICLDITYGIFAGVVPILIPFSQTYQKTPVTIFGQSMNLGSMLSIVAVTCSLLGTIVHGLQRASKIKERASLAYRYGVESDAELTLFLSRSGDYDISGEPDDRKAFKAFVKNSQEIRKKFNEYHVMDDVTTNSEKKEKKEGKSAMDEA